MLDLRQGLSDTAAAECSPSTRHFVQQTSKGEQVCPMVDLGGASRLLGRHVAGGSHDLPRYRAEHCRRYRGVAADSDRGEFGEAEIKDLRVAALRQEDVVRLQVAVNDAGRMSRRERLGDLRRDPECLLERQRPLGERLPQRLPLEILPGR